MLILYEKNDWKLWAKHQQQEKYKNKTKQKQDKNKINKKKPLGQRNRRKQWNIRAEIQKQEKTGN